MRKRWAKSLWSIFMALALYLSVLICTRKYTTLFIAFLTLGHHVLVNLACGRIASYRFKNSNAKYIQIKNKVLQKILTHQVTVGGVEFRSKSDQRTNILGLVLNIINFVLFALFEIFLFMPKILCDPYEFELFLPKRIGYSTYAIELNSFNEIIPAEVSRAFALVAALTLFVFVILFEGQLKEHREKIKRTTAKTPRKKPLEKLKKIEWNYPLYDSLVDIAVRKNYNKYKFWYEKSQLKDIEALVSNASKYTELKLEQDGDRFVSFKVIDTLNDRVLFIGLFI